MWLIQLEVVETYQQGFQWYWETCGSLKTSQAVSFWNWPLWDFLEMNYQVCKRDCLIYIALEMYSLVHERDYSV